MILEPETKEKPKKDLESEDTEDADNDSSELEQPQQNSQQDNVQGAEALPQETENVEKSEKSDSVNITLVSIYLHEGMRPVLGKFLISLLNCFLKHLFFLLCSLIQRLLQWEAHEDLPIKV